MERLTHESARRVLKRVALFLSECIFFSFSQKLFSSFYPSYTEIVFQLSVEP